MNCHEHGAKFFLQSTVRTLNINFLIPAFRKKVAKLAKEKECEIIGEWIRSMINHFYWCAFSTKDGNGEVILEKWLSLINHIHNKHRGHGKVYKSVRMDIYETENGLNIVS